MKYVAFIFILFFNSSYTLSEEIISPFGITMGSPLDKEYIDEKIKMREDGICYKIFDPPIQNSNFYYYLVCVTPLSYTVHTIMAKNSYSVFCYPLHFDLVEILGKKYNLEYKKPSIKDKGYKTILKNESLKIMVECTRNIPLELSYELISKKMKQLQEKEKLLFEDDRISGVDQSGL